MNTEKTMHQNAKSKRRLRRGPWENSATAVIALGVFMLMQPFSKWAFSHSFLVLLIGFIEFTIVTHFPED